MDNKRTFGGLTVIKANDPFPWGITMAIFGRPGSGKTTLVSDAQDSPHGRNVVFLDVEGGRRSISHRGDIEVIPINEWRDFSRFRAELQKTKDPPWGTIVLDNMSEIQNRELSSRVADTAEPQWGDWKKNTNQMLNLTRFFRDYGQRNGVNIFYLMWDKTRIEKGDEDGAIAKYDLGFTPSLASQFPGIIDIVAYLTVDRNPPIFSRTLSFAPVIGTVETAAKFRRSMEEAASKIPLEISYTLKDHLMVDLLATLKGGEPWPIGKYKSSSDLRREAMKASRQQQQVTTNEDGKENG